MTAVGYAAVLVPAAAFFVAFPQRTDYAGHFLAGAGGTALVLAAARALRGGRPWDTLALVAACVAVGVGTEATVFRIAIFDPVDLAIQSLGAVLVGCASVGRPRSVRHAMVQAGFALMALIAGFALAFA